MFLRVSLLAAAILNTFGVAANGPVQKYRGEGGGASLPDAYVYRGKASFQCKTLQFLCCGCWSGCTKLESNLVASVSSEGITDRGV